MKTIKEICEGQKTWHQMRVIVDSIIDGLLDGSNQKFTNSKKEFVSLINDAEDSEHMKQIFKYIATEYLN